MTVVDWWVVTAIASFLALTIIWDRAADRRRRRSTDTYLRQSEQRYMTEVRRQP